MTGLHQKNHLPILCNQNITDTTWRKQMANPLLYKTIKGWENLKEWQQRTMIHLSRWKLGIILLKKEQRVCKYQEGYATKKIWFDEILFIYH